MATNADLGTIYASLELEGFNEFLKTLGIANKGLGNLTEKLTKTGKKFEEVGKKLTKSLTAPILGVGAASLKLASDFEVSSKKFNKAFEGVTSSAKNSVDTLNSSFGVAKSQATSLLANTGDLLKGFGATSQEALTLSTEVQKVAVALSAYNGVPVKEASLAATKALLGETESMKLLGVAIRQTDVDVRLQAEGMGKLEGQARLLAKAQITLKLINEQSADAIASVAENQETLAFQTQKLIGDLKDLGVDIGTILIPIAKEFVGEITEIVKNFSNLDDRTKKNIITLAGFTAVIGPLLIGLGKLIQVIPLVSGAFAFLAANPVVAVLAGLAAVAVAIGTIVKVAEGKEIDKISHRFEELAKQIDKTAEATTKLAIALKQRFQTQQSSSDERLLANLEQLSEQYGITQTEIVELLRVQGDLSDEFLNNLQKVANLKDGTEAYYKSLQDGRKATKELADEQIRLNNALAASYEEYANFRNNELKVDPKFAKQNAELQTEIDLLIQLRDAGELSNEELYTQVLSLRETLLSSFNKDVYSGITGAKEAFDELLSVIKINRDAIKKEQDKQKESTVESIEEIGEAGEKVYTKFAETSKQAGEQAVKSYGEQTEAIKPVIQQVQSYNGFIEDRAKLEEEYTQRLLTQTGDRLLILESQYDKAISEAQRTGAETAEIELFYANERIKIEEDFAKEKEALNKKIEDERKVEINSEIADKIAINDEKRALLDAELLDIQEKANEEARIKKELEDKKRALDKETQELRLESFQETTNNVKLVTDSLFNAFSSALQSSQEREIKTLNETQGTKLNLFDEATQAKIDKLNEDILGEEEYNKQIEKIEKERAEERLILEKKQALEKYKIDKEQFESNKKMSLAVAAIDIATAIITALPNIGLAVATGLAGAVQVGSILAQEAPDPPKFANGGIVSGFGNSGLNALVGEAGPEAIIPLNDETFKNLGNAISESSQGLTSNTNTSSQPINVYIDGVRIAQERIVQDGFNNNKFNIQRESII